MVNNYICYYEPINYFLINLKWKLTFIEYFLSTRFYSKHLMCVNPFNHHNSLSQYYYLLIAPFYKEGNVASQDLYLTQGCTISECWSWHLNAGSLTSASELTTSLFFWFPANVSYQPGQWKSLVRNNQLMKWCHTWYLTYKCQRQFMGQELIFKVTDVTL